MLTKRQNMIISIMNRQKDWIIGKDLARLLNVSDRTIRNDIAAINDFYKDTMIEANIKKGYRIQEEKVRNLIIATDKQMPETVEERRLFILEKLLKVGQIHLYELSKEMCVSEFSLENDINKTRKLLGNYPGLKIDRNSNMLRLSGERM